MQEDEEDGEDGQTKGATQTKGEQKSEGENRKVKEQLRAKCYIQHLKLKSEKPQKSKIENKYYALQYIVHAEESQRKQKGKT